jgi:hypothetical protein
VKQIEVLTNGVAFVGLSLVRDPFLVTTVVLRSLGLREVEGRTPSEALRYHLREKRLLLVLDNFEYVSRPGLEPGDQESEMMGSSPHQGQHRQQKSRAAWEGGRFRKCPA